MGLRTNAAIDGLVDQFLNDQERDFRHVKVDENLLEDEAFYKLINTMRMRAMIKRRIHLSDFVNFDFKSAEHNKGACSDPVYRRLIISLCVACMVKGKN